MLLARFLHSWERGERRVGAPSLPVGLPAFSLARRAPYRVRPLGGWGSRVGRGGERDGGALILTGASPGSGMKAEGGSQSPDAYSGWGEEPSGGASEAPAAQGSPGRQRRTAEPVAGHALVSGLLYHLRRRPEPAGRTPARLGPLAPHHPGAATRTLGVRPTISAQRAPSHTHARRPCGPRRK